MSTQYTKSTPNTEHTYPWYSLPTILTYSLHIRVPRSPNTVLILMERMIQFNIRNSLFTDSLCGAVDDLHHQNQNYFSSYVLLGKVRYGDFSADDRQTKPIALPLGHVLAGKK